MKKVLIFTKVFRFEKVIERCFQSVINQTYSNWVYYLWVSDDTIEVAKQYADLDARIHICNQKPTGERNETIHMWQEFLTKESADYLCTVDADDYLDEDFVRKMVGFLEENHLDIAFSDRRYVMGEVPCVSKEGKGENVIIHELAELKEKFSQIYMGVRTIWGTLFTARSLMEFDFSRLPENMKLIIYGGDTQTVITVLRNCKRIGMLNEPLYVYNLQQGVSKTYFPERRDADVFLYNFSQKFLDDVGGDSVENTIFLNRVLANAVMDTVEVIGASDAGKEKKVEDIAYICGYEEVQYAFEFFKIYYDRLLERRLPTNYFFNPSILPEKMEQKEYETLVKIFRCIAPKFRNIELKDTFGEWLYDSKGLEYLYKDNELFSMAFLLGSLNLYKEQKLLSALSIIEQLCPIPWLKKYFSNYVFVFDSRDILFYMLKNDKERAIQCIEEKIVQENEFCSAYLELYMDYTAAIGDEDAYIRACLLQCDVLVRNSEILQAKQKIEELMQMGVSGEWIEKLWSAVNGYGNADVV